MEYPNLSSKLVLDAFSNFHMLVMTCDIIKLCKFRFIEAIWPFEILGASFLLPATQIVYNEKLLDKIDSARARAASTA